MAELSIRQAAFVREYLISGNASDAYRKAGYSHKGADVSCIRLLGNARIAAAVAEGRKKIEKKAEAVFGLRLDDILQKLAHQVTVDRTKLTAHKRGACRYCHGIEHHYQWKTPREFSEAVELHMLKGEAYAANHPPPEQEGGYGYKITNKPDPDCPECAGLGVGYTVLADTDTMTEAEKAVFEGVKETRDGIQYLLADRGKAIENLGRHLGLADKARDQGISEVAAAIAQINARGSAMPISRNYQSADADEEDIDPLADPDEDDA